MQNVREILLLDQREPIRLLHVGSDFRKQFGRRNANGRIEAFADIVADARFDVAGDLFRVSRLAFGSIFCGSLAPVPMTKWV